MPKEYNCMKCGCEIDYLTYQNIGECDWCYYIGESREEYYAKELGIEVETVVELQQIVISEDEAPF